MKLDVCNDAFIMDMLGSGFDYIALPASHTCGGVVLAWRWDTWGVTNPNLNVNSITAKCKLLASNAEWWITTGPQTDVAKINFVAGTQGHQGSLPGDLDGV